MIVRFRTIFLVLLCSLAFHATVLAQDEIDLTQPPDTPLIDGTIPLMGSTSATFFDSPATLTFNLLGFEEPVQLISPLADTTYGFGLPAEWRLVPGQRLQLQITSFVSADGNIETDPSDNSAYHGSLTLELNNIPLETVVVDWVGDQTLNFDIPPEALVTERTDRRHILSLNYESQYSCGSNIQSGVIISPESFFFVPFDQVKAPLDLRLLPYPIYQRNFLPDVALLIVPDEPTQEEMQSAIITSAGIGKMTGNQVQIAVLKASQLTPEIQESEHLIFIGKPSAFPILSNIDLPLELDDEIFAVDESQEESGIVQIAASPWNDAKVILVVSGNTDNAVVKASRAISSGQIRTGNHLDLAIIERVSEQTAPLLESEFSLLTLESLGYDTFTTTNERQTNRFYFSLTNVDDISPNATFNLFYGHSSLLNYERSNINVRINEQPIGSVRFSDESTNLFNAQQMSIPRSALRVGENEIRIDTQLIPADPCTQSDSNLIWATIHSESYIELPPLEINPLQPTSLPPRAWYDVEDYPGIFSNDIGLANLVFILPSSDPAAWSVAARVASDLGNRTSGDLIQFKTVWDDVSPTEDELENSRFIVVGRASTNQFIQEISALLPAPFAEDQDKLDEANLPIAYDYPDNKSLGYLQVIASPWDERSPILIISGSTDEGLRWAGDALNTPWLFDLSGNISIIDEAFSISYSLGREPVTVVDPLIPIPTTSPSDPPFYPIPNELQITMNPANPDDSRPGWLLPAIIGSAGLFGLILVVVIIIYSIQYLRRRRAKIDA